MRLGKVVGCRHGHGLVSQEERPGGEVQGVGGELGRTRLAARVRFGFRSESNEKPSLALSRALAWSDLYSGKIICSFWPSGERTVAMKRAWRERAARPSSGSCRDAAGLAQVEAGPTRAR